MIIVRYNLIIIFLHPMSLLDPALGKPRAVCLRALITVYLYHFVIK